VNIIRKMEVEIVKFFSLNSGSRIYADYSVVSYRCISYLADVWDNVTEEESYEVY
jgi:hypothetical protein